ncbi:outer membrane lipoprotein-sorting protein [Halobacteroides halobius DSM 5150]|uniref:Outer membrane lipoprotein-sorting protein n=1 Tax=Halobacteroides halobius (strain ATCC 35273 / DSM 5150 / MD-1) TaxID=748449 RepID=L0K7P4_HALHC|nr:outer membrane lipoprotein-sorting protein [Halobacteroides halobius]AGB40575.1 outer membrane lipoprotein-sorting protein [Halobacteroides halobius DSM 5150]
MKKLVSLLVLISLLVGLSGLTGAADLTGEDVLDKIKESIDANSAQLTLKMELYSSSGSKRERKMKVWTQEQNQDKAMMRFLAPASIEGTGFLSQDKANGEEEMYLYMPALGGVRKIAGSQKNGSFVGTDFSYNDLSILGGGNYKEDYEATILNKDSSQYLLKLVPTDEEIEYKYGKMWVRKSNWVPSKIKFYDAQGKLYKVLTNDNIKQIDGYWTPYQMTMKNKQQGTKTVLYIKEITYDQQINPRRFTTRNLRRY